MDKIAFNVPFLTGKETHYIYDAVYNGKISGNGKYTKLCHDFFETRYKFNKCLLTSSCTDALEMAAILIDIKEGDEVIAPSFTFVSTVNAFVLRGAKIVFADCGCDNPNIDVDKIESLITNRTKAIVPVHYAGIACDMDRLMEIANKHNIYVVEDAAQAIDSYYIGKDGIKKRLGSIGQLATFSFHETKNIISGEGGLLIINDKSFEKRAEIIWEKGTNRNAFWRGEVNKYGWKDIGSSFLPSDIIAAFLYAQLENESEIQTKRKYIWSHYHENLKKYAERGFFSLPNIPDFATNNAHIFYIVCRNQEERDNLISFLKNKNIWAMFHYLPLHQSDYYMEKHDGRNLPFCIKYSDCLLRLPLYFQLNEHDVKKVCDKIGEFFNNIYEKRLPDTLNPK